MASVIEKSPPAGDISAHAQPEYGFDRVPIEARPNKMSPISPDSKRRRARCIATKVPQVRTNLQHAAERGRCAGDLNGISGRHRERLFAEHVLSGRESGEDDLTMAQVWPRR